MQTPLTTDPGKARRLLEELRWPNGPICPRTGCNHNEVYAIKPKAGSKIPARDGLYKCAACRKQFTVTVGTIFEDSHIPLGKWLTAIALLCSSKKGVSAHQLHRMLGITYKSAWFMAHRLRYAMGPDKPLARLLKGTVEVDETFVGGKTPPQKKWDNKTPVVALIERGGEVRTRVVSSVTQKNLAKCLNEAVAMTAGKRLSYRPLTRWQKFTESKNCDELQRNKPRSSRSNKAHEGQLAISPNHTRYFGGASGLWW